MTGISAVQNQSYVTGNGPNPNGNYTVVSGDTLWDIARANGVSLDALIAANPQIANPDLIYPGDKITIPGGGGTGGAGAVDGPDGSAGAGGSSNAYDVARQYLGQNASSLKVNQNDDLPMNANVPSNVCCANFVSAVLTEAGQLPANLHTDSVAQLDRTLRDRGWTPVDPAQARPGDVVIIQGGGVSHTEIYAGNGKMIGSNNVNADGTQRVSEGNLDWALQHGAVILRAPAGTPGTTEAGGAPGVNGPTPSGDGDRQARIDQAMAYFQSQGWSKAQAAGIVANLDAESGMDPNIHQHGGGPGYGLAQWEGPRQASFREWAGKDIQDSTFGEQLQFIQWELTHTESGAGRALHGASSPSEAASIVTRLYERPADSAGEAVRRGDRAVDIYNR